MKVVLIQDVKGLGKKLDIIEASEGYARNYLIPRKLAKIADNKAISETKSKLESEKYKKDQEKKAATEIKNKIEKETLKFILKVGENGKLFGSVTEKEIAQQINEKYNVKIDKKKVTLNLPVKALGVYTAKVKLYEEIVADVKLNVVEK